MDAVCLSVCLSVTLSVPGMTLSREFKGRRKLKISSKEARDTRDP